MSSRGNGVDVAVFYTAARIDEYLAELEVAGEPLDSCQSEMLRRAIAHLRAGECAPALDAAMRACRPHAYRNWVGIALSAVPTLTIAKVRAELDQVLAERSA